MNQKNVMTTEMQAITTAKTLISEGYTVAYMNVCELEDFVWGYLYDNELQYKMPIKYLDNYGNKCAAIVYEEVSFRKA